MCETDGVPCWGTNVDFSGAKYERRRRQVLTTIKWVWHGVPYEALLLLQVAQMLLVAASAVCLFLSYSTFMPCFCFYACLVAFRPPTLGLPVGGN